VVREKKFSRPINDAIFHSVQPRFSLNCGNSITGIVGAVGFHSYERHLRQMIFVERFEQTRNMITSKIQALEPQERAEGV